jgi:hypothetical protein
LRIAIFRNPTFTDTTISFTSNHLIQHKYAAVRYLYNRLESYNLQQREYQQELNIIHNTLHNNSFPIKPHKPPTPNPDKQITTHTTQKWASFTYIGKETSHITNIFKRTVLRITSRTAYTLANLLTHKDRAHDKYSLLGVYKLNCPDCHKTYVGQTGRLLSTRYKEHKTAWRNHNTTSNFAQRLIEEAQSSDPMNKIMKIVHCYKKGAHLNTIEKFHTHTESAKNFHLNDPQTILPNAIFDTLIKTDQPTIKPYNCPTPSPRL